MLVRMCRTTYQIHTPRKKGPCNIHTRGQWYIVHENTKILTFSDACVFQCVCMLHTIPKMCYPCNIQRFFLALKIEEKIYLIVYTLEPPRVKFKKTKRSNIVYPILPCIRHYIKVGCNGIYVKANVQLICKLT